MPITRAKATGLLNQREMTLYDDSRANALRNLDSKALSARITRARAARDRARDLVQRQKLGSRDRTGSKRGKSGVDNQRSKDKVEVMTDILRRFETQLASTENAEKATRKAQPSAGRTATKKATRRVAKKAAAPAKGANKKAGEKTVAATKKAVAKSPARKRADQRTIAVAAGTAPRKSAKNSTGKSPAKTAKRKLTPKQALKRTQALLDAKKERDRAPRPWEVAPGGGNGNDGRPVGYQSNAAARRAQQLHAAEARLPAIMGSISTRDRINQGKRDHRRDGDDS